MKKAGRQLRPGNVPNNKLFGKAIFCPSRDARKAGEKACAAEEPMRRLLIQKAWSFFQDVIMKHIAIAVIAAGLAAGCALTPEGPQPAPVAPAMQGANDVQGAPIYSGPAPGAGIGIGIGAGSWGGRRGAGVGLGLGW